MTKLEHTICNLCGSDSTELLFEQRDSLTGRDTVFSVVRCRQCSLVYVNPRPSSDDIHLFYPEDFVSYQFEIFDPPRNLRERLLSFVTRSSAKQKVATVLKLAGINGQMKVLDVGCGKGGFLHELRKSTGCDVAGLDFDAKSAKYCRESLDINVVHGDINSLEKLGSQYDLVTMWHYLEHEYDPLNALRKLNSRLAKDQLLIVEVPNADSLENKIFRSRSYLYDIPRHLYNFSPDTITQLLHKAGFEVQQIQFPYFSGGFIGSVQEVFFDGRIYRNLKGNIFFFLLLSQLLFPVEYLLSKTRKGSIMTILARKTDEVH